MLVFPLAQGVALPNALHLHELKFFLSNKWPGLPLLKASWEGTECQARGHRCWRNPRAAPLGQAALASRAQKCRLPTANRTGSFLQAQGIGRATCIKAPGQQAQAATATWFLGVNLDERTLECLALMEKDPGFPIPGWVLSELSLGLSSVETLNCPPLASPGAWPALIASLSFPGFFSFFPMPP